MIGNAHSMAILKDMILNKGISDVDADAWLTSLAFQQKPAREMLVHLRPLIEQPQPRKQALLGISALVSQYCQSRANCHEDEEVKAIAAALKRLLARCDASDIAGKRSLILALKAISNAGHMPQLIPIVMRCINGPNTAMDVKVAAVEAFRRMGCGSNVDRSGLETLFSNREIDSELRIAAYLAMMTCPSVATLEKVKAALAAEKVNQVGSFVWTHLTNLAETSDPHKQQIRALLEDAALKKQFNLNKLKYSRNIEKSAFFKSLNTGAKMESNLVWSQKSFLPRSATLNMTMDLFGKSFNFLEVGGRVQGLESLLEKYLGPDSKSKQKSTSRVKRSIEQLKRLDQTFKKLEENIGGALNVKVFGHQIAYVDLWKNDLQQKNFNFLQLLQSLRETHSFEWHKNFMFLDTEYSIPTVSGFPLKLSLNGTASVSLKMSGKLDMMKLTQWPSVFDVRAKLVPSAAVELSGMMGMEIPNSGRYGIKMVSIAHTSTTLDGQITMSSDNKFKANLKMPRSKQEIMDFTTRFFIVQRSNEREQSMLPTHQEKSHHVCSGSAVERILGVQLCAQLRYPVAAASRGTPLMFFTGPISANVNLFRRDIHQEYLIEGILRRNGQEVRLLVDTPKSKVDRRLLAEFKLDQAQRAVMMQLGTPWKKVSFNGALTNSPTLKRAQLKFYMDGNHLFNVLLENKFTRDKSNRITISPQLILSIPGIQPITAKAAITRSKDITSFNAAFYNILRQPVKISAFCKRLADFNRYSGEISLKTHLFNGKFFSFVQKIKGVTMVRSSIKYQMTGGQKRTLGFFHKSIDKSSGHMIRLISYLRTSFSQFPQANAEVSSELQMRKDLRYMKSSVSARWGQEYRHNALFKSYHDYVSRGTKRTFIGTAKLVVPVLGLDHDVKVDTAFDHHVMIGTCSINMPQNKKAVFNAHFQRSLNGLLKLTGQISGRVQNRTIKWSGSLEQTSQLRIFAFKTGLNYQLRHYSLSGKAALGHFQYSLNTKLKATGMPSCTLQVQLNINSQQPKLNITANVGDKIYSAFGSYKLVNDDRTLLNFESGVDCPRRSIKLQGSTKLEGDNSKVNLKVMWDARRDASRAVANNFQVKSTKESRSNCGQGSATNSLSMAQHKESGKIVSRRSETQELFRGRIRDRQKDWRYHAVRLERWLDRKGSHWHDSSYNTICSLQHR